MKIRTPENGPRILSFEEFTKLGADNRPRYNNFYLYFFDDSISLIAYQSKDWYKKFVSENPDLATYTRERIMDRDESSPNPFKELERDMYEAYKVMRTYGVSDEELFT